MDIIKVLDAAACIFNITNFLKALIFNSQVSEVQSSSSLPDRTDEHTIPTSIAKLRTALTDIRAPSQPQQQPSANPYRASTNSSALEELIASQNTSLALLEDVQSMMGQSRQGMNIRAWLRSHLAPSHYGEKLKRLDQAVTDQVSAILSIRLSGLSNTVAALQNEARYARPEHESQVDTMSRQLHDLKLEARLSAENDSTAFTEASIGLLKARLVRLIELEDVLLADTIALSLNYNSRPVRFDSIPQAHKDTFQWAFQSRLSDWLASGSGTFWISGKPGSGKSTLMKFISKHPQTKELLRHWAGSSDTLAVAAHFFWIAGTPIQKSWQGLLQSLLFDLLRGHPDTVSMVSPTRWAAAKIGQWQLAAEPWSVSELTAGLRALAAADHLSLRICFFIDGLDEYDSNHAELCEILRDVASSPHIKMCLSSRGWPVFQKNFGGDGQESLDIHELTRNDIRKFVNDQLQLHSRWTSKASERDTLAKAELLDLIVARADGVFLWAFFVTRSLREGLSSEERIADLRRRFSQLPSDLDQLFKHLLENVTPADHPKMAGILSASMHALEPLHIDLYWQLEKEFDGLDSVSRGLVGAVAPNEISARRKQITSSINEKTKGLLRLVNDRVEFLHRTVNDFVSTKDIDEYLRSKLPADYNGFVSIATAYLGFLKTTPQDHRLVAGVIRQGPGLTTGPFIAHLNQALVYASEALKQSDQPGSIQYRHTEELLDEYEAAVERMVNVGHITVRGINSQRCDPRLIFREELLRHDVTSYLAERIRKLPDFFEVFDESPLFAALTPMSRNSGESPAPTPGILDILLRRGEDPNVRPRSACTPGVSDMASPWVRYARSTMSVFNMLSGPSMFPALRWNDSLHHATWGRLMAYGADPNMPLLDRAGARTVFSHFLDISLSKFLGEKCFEDYLGSLDAFLRAGASLGVPDFIGKIRLEAEVAHGNLARHRPEESVLTSFCTELKGLLARLAADPRRATFVSSVVKKLVLHCSGREQDLRELESAMSQGLPAELAPPLSRLIADEMQAGQERRITRTASPIDNSFSEESGSRSKRPRRV